MKKISSLEQVPRDRVGAGTRREEDLLARAGPLQKLDDDRAGWVLDLKTAHVHGVDRVHVQSVEPLGLVVVIGTVVGHEGPLAIGLDIAVAAAVLHGVVLDQHLDALRRQPLAHEIAERARAHRAEEDRGLAQRVRDGERVERAAAEGHLLPVHHHVLGRARQLVHIDDHIGACDSDEQHLSHGDPSSIQIGSGHIIATVHHHVLGRARQLVHIDDHIGACDSDEQHLSHGDPSSIQIGSGHIIANNTLSTPTAPQKGAPVTDQPRITTAASAEGAATAGHIDKLAIVVVTFKRQELLAKLFDSFCALTRAPWRIIIVDNEHSDRTRDIDKLAIVVVTFKRQELLAKLFDSFCALTRAPWRIIIVDNEHSDRTREMVEDLGRRTDDLWGVEGDAPDAEGGTARVVYAPQEDNLGGAGGFSAGVKRGYELGAEWFWVMDDDVMVVPEALDRLEPWTRTHRVVQGSRYDYDGGPFYWQYHFIVPLGIPNPIAPAAFGDEGYRTMNTMCFEGGSRYDYDGGPFYWQYHFIVPLGIPNPIAPAAFGDEGYRTMNTMCFEGGLFARSVVDEIGFPDPRFFIYWDDTVYGYLASKVTEAIVVPDIILQRTRDIPNWDIAGVRQLNGTSDMNRYHIMRNRGYMMQYFRLHGDYNRFLFGLGTAATFAKEVIRLIAVDHKFKTGMPNRGYMMQYFRLHGDYNRFLFGLGTAATFAKEVIRLIAVDHKFKTGMPALFRGMRDARKIYRDATWEPMPRLRG